MLQEIGQKVAMHAVAMKPRYLSPETVPAEAVEGGVPYLVPPVLSYANAFCPS